jgi:hypothetical protein
VWTALGKVREISPERAEDETGAGEE